MNQNDYLLIIDGSSLLSTQYYGNLPKEMLYAKTPEERNQYLPKLMQTSKGVYTNGVFGFMKALLRILQQQMPSHVAICWDLTRNTFRRELYLDYKGNRKETPEPLKEQFALCQDILDQMGFVQFKSNDYEADDFAGTLANTFAKEMPIKIMTKDHDYLQLINEQVNVWMVMQSKAKAEQTYKKHHLKQTDFIAPDNVFCVTPDNAKAEYGFNPDKTVMLKALLGDTADNIPGVKGVGEKTALALVNAYDSVDAIYDLISNQSKEELDAIKLDWKERLGLKRSPLPYLLADDSELLVGHKAAKLSETLATIKLDVPLDVVDINQLSLTLDYEQVKECFTKLEFSSLNPDSIPTKYYNEDVIQANLQSIDAIEVTDFSEATTILACLEQKTKLLCHLELNEQQLNGIYVMSSDAIYHIQVGGFIMDSMLKDEVSKWIESDSLFIGYQLKNILSAIPCQQPKNCFDLEIAAYLLNPLKNEYPVEDLFVEYQIPSFKADSEEVVRLARMFELYKTLSKALKDQQMLSLFQDIEMPTLFTLFAMEKEGVLVKKEALKDYGDHLIGRITELEQNIYEQAGEVFNINSPKQLGVILFEKLLLPTGKKTKTGYSTSADVLEKLKFHYPIVNDILEYRQLTKLKSTYADGLMQFIEEDGRIHTKFNQTVTATGRLSSTEPNLQNIPMRQEIGRLIRKVFVPKDGCVFVDADYSQIELRLLAALSKDEALLNAYKNHEDIHQLTASKVFHVPFEQVTDLQRRNAKAVNFGIVYGISAYGLSQDLNISRKEASTYIENYFATYPGIKRYLDEQVEFAKQNQYTTTLFNRIRPIPEMTSTNFATRNFGERIAMNSPIQGTAADIMKIAMIRVHQQLKQQQLNARLVLQIHDELLIETPENEVEQVLSILTTEMMNAANLDVDLEISTSVGTDWYEAK